MPTPINKHQQKTKKDQVVELLRHAILSGDLEPGNRLTQEELAARFNVSMTPVREAIQQLVAEGILDHSPYKGVQVAEVSPLEVTELYLMRGAVEALAVRVGVPNLKISDVQRLRSLHEQIKIANVLGNVLEIRKLNYEFHDLLYQAANMPRLYKLIQTLWIQSPWDTLYVIPNRTARIVEEHQRIVAAIDQGDALAASQAMQDHLEAGMHMLIDFLGKDTH
ncbi:MAG: GntR family transcriptional regulator [Anaerolineae bacterium]|nr:GntR family transcriptional regulator [Anaerolineae bacterium]